MNIQIQISDKVYQQLVAGGNRIQGSLALVSPTEGNFHAHRRSASEQLGGKYIKLAHGRASVTDERVSLTLRIKTDETGIIPSEAILGESRKASEFVYDVFDNMIGY